MLYEFATTVLLFLRRAIDAGKFSAAESQALDADIALVHQAIRRSAETIARDKAEEDSVLRGKGSAV